MAWISVHDTVDGPKLRDLYKKLKCSKFEATGILVYLWHWGLHNADENGLILRADAEDIEIHFQGLKNGCSIDPKSIVDGLIETGWIDSRDGCLYLHDWAVWQKEWYKYQKRLAKDAERKRNAVQKKYAQAEKDTAIPQEIPPEKPEEIPVTIPAEKAVKRKQKTYSEDFTKFWSVYPRNDKKAEAFECYLARIKNGFSPGEMLKAAETYAAQMKKQHTEPRYIMQAKTFLGPHLTFTDYLPKKSEMPKYDDLDGNPFDSFTWGD